MDYNFESSFSPSKSPRMTSLKKLRQPMNVLRADDRIRNERQKTMLLVEARRLLEDNSDKLIEQGQELIKRTRELIAESIQGLKKKPK